MKFTIRLNDTLRSKVPLGATSARIQRNFPGIATKCGRASLPDFMMRPICRSDMVSAGLKVDGAAREATSGADRSAVTS